MRGIAAGVRGAAGDQSAAAEEIRTPGLDRLLWLFLRLLLSKTALDRFLQTMNDQEITTRLAELRKNLAAAQSSGGDERIVRSLQDSIAMGELRLDNFGRAKKNAEFVSIELDRIEGKIQALAEMAVNRQDPDFLSSQVDSAAESMRQTEKAVSELQHLTGLADQLRSRPRFSRPICARCCAMTPDEQLASAAGEPAGVVPRVGRRSSRTCIFPARPPRSSSTATPTTCFASTTDRTDAGSPRYGVLAEFLAEQLFGRWSLVLHYDLGRGLRAFAGRDEQRLKDMVALANKKLGDLSALPKDPAATSRCSTASSATTSWRPRQDRLSLAVILDQASYVFPSGEPGRLNLQASSQLVTMLNWAMSPHVKRLNMAFVMVDEKLADLSDRLTGNPHVATIEVPLPDEKDAGGVHQACPQEPRR